MEKPVNPAPKPYTAGWKAPWKREWGPMRDGHSRLGRLCNQIEAQLRKQYKPRTPIDRMRIRQAAEFLALQQQVAAGTGTDTKFTPRKLVSLACAAERCLDKVEAHMAPVKKTGLSKWKAGQARKVKPVPVMAPASPSSEAPIP